MTLTKIVRNGTAGRGRRRCPRSRTSSSSPTATWGPRGDLDRARLEDRPARATPTATPRAIEEGRLRAGHAQAMAGVQRRPRRRPCWTPSTAAARHARPGRRAVTPGRARRAALTALAVDIAEAVIGHELASTADPGAGRPAPGRCASPPTTATSWPASTPTTWPLLGTRSTALAPGPRASRSWPTRRSNRAAACVEVAACRSTPSSAPPSSGCEAPWALRPRRPDRGMSGRPPVTLLDYRRRGARRRRPSPRHRSGRPRRRAQLRDRGPRRRHRRRRPPSATTARRSGRGRRPRRARPHRHAARRAARPAHRRRRCAADDASPDVPVGDGLLGRVLDGLGRPIDDGAAARRPGPRQRRRHAAPPPAARARSTGQLPPRRARARHADPVRARPAHRHLRRLRRRQVDACSR